LCSRGVARQFALQILWNVSERLGRRRVKKVFIAQQLAQGCNDNHEFRVTKPGFLDHKPLFLAFSFVGVDQAFSVSSALLLVSDGVTPFSDKASLVDQPFYCANGKLVQFLALVRFEQLTL
jgi:hypothetical protein